MTHSYVAENSTFEQRLLREITSSPDVQGAFSGLSLTENTVHDSYPPYHSPQYSPHSHYSYARQQAQSRKNRPIPKWSERRTGRKQWGEYDENASSDGESDCPENAPPQLRELYERYHFNPRTVSMDLNNCRFFVIKSFSEDDVFRSIKHSCWCSTKKGNRNLQIVHEETLANNGGPMYLFFSVNGSGHFCGIAEMTSNVDMNVETKIWVDDRFKGKFNVRWHYVKDVPNSAFKHIGLGNKENKSVTRSRDTQEVPFEGGMQMVQIIHSYPSATSIFDDFSFYERREIESSRGRGFTSSSKDISVTIYNRKSDVNEEDHEGNYELEKEESPKKQTMPKFKQKKFSGKQTTRDDYSRSKEDYSHSKDDYSRSNGARDHGTRGSYSKPKYDKKDSYNNSERDDSYSKYGKSNRGAHKGDFSYKQNSRTNTSENKHDLRSEEKFSKRKYNDEYPSAGMNSSVNIQIADQISDDLLQELATAKASGDHKTAGQLRQELWVVQDLARGLQARIEQPETEEAYKRVMFRIAMKSNPASGSDKKGSRNSAQKAASDEKVVAHSADLLKVDPKKEYRKFLVKDSSHPKEKPKMFRMERSSVLDRASTFLPSIASANSALDDPEERSKLDMEQVEGDEQVIEMNLAVVNADDLRESDEEEKEENDIENDIEITLDKQEDSPISLEENFNVSLASENDNSEQQNPPSAANKLIEELNNNEEDKVNEVT